MALAIPVVAIATSGLQKVWRLRLEEAQLLLRRELSELNERVDFTERMLVRGRGPESSEK